MGATEWLSKLCGGVLKFYLLWVYMALTLSVSQCPEECNCPNEKQVACNRAGLREIPTFLVPSITTLDMTRNDLSQITISSLVPIRHVANLKLKNNRIEHIEDGAFHVMINLQTLDLSGNQLHNIHQGTFSGATKLLHLDLSNNKLERVDGAFAEMLVLTRLDIRNNKITSLTQFTFRDLTSLRYLLLSGNHITHVDRRAFRNLAKLMYLVLKGNPVGNADNIEFTSYYLSYVDMSECGLRYVPRGLPNSIRYLQLRRNNMTVIHQRDLGQVPYLSILVLDENGITFIEDGTFTPMIYLQQLWLNGNKLTMIPRPLPSALQRILMDSNQIGAVTDIFPDESKINTLSFMGNNISYISPYAFRKIPELKSLDLSNNLLHSIYSDTFVNSTQLKTLQLSKNPLTYFYSRCFHGLTNLKTLTLAYIDTNATVHDNIFMGLEKLKKLDLDSSPGIIWSIFTSDDLLQSLRTVEDLSLQSAELSHMRSDFPLLFPNLGVLHISSTRWHCDTSMMWFRDWLMETSVMVEHKEEIVCYSPRNVYGREIASLQHSDFVPATTTEFTTTLKTFPPVTSPTPASGAKVDENDVLPPAVTPHNFQWHSLPASLNRDFSFEDVRTNKPFNMDDFSEASGFDHVDEEDQDGDSLEEALNNHQVGKNSKSKGGGRRVPTWEEFWGRTSPTPMMGNENKKYDGGLNSDNLEIHTLPNYSTSDPSNSPASGNSGQNGDKDKNSNGSKSLLVVIATSIAAVLFVALLITAIVFVCCRKRKKDVYQNAIKYQQRNDILYFMPNNGQVEGATTSQGVSRTASREQMQLVSGRDINHEGPHRIYKWEDF